MMSGGSGGSSGLRYYLWKSAQQEVENQKEAYMKALGLGESEARRKAMKNVPSPRVIHDEFGLVHDGYEPTGPEDGFRLADRLRDELEMSQKLSNREFEYLYQADWIAAHPDEADDLTDEDWKQIVEDYLEKMGWENHRYMIVAHDHTDHRDRHVIIDRYDPLTDQTLDMSWVVNRRRDAQREIEEEYDLRQVEPRDRPRIGLSTQNLRKRMANRNEYNELEQFIQARADDDTVATRGDVKEILKEARLEIVKENENYLTVDFDGSKHRIGEEDVPAIDWGTAEMKCYRRAATDLRPREIASNEESSDEQEKGSDTMPDQFDEVIDRNRPDYATGGSRNTTSSEVSEKADQGETADSSSNEEDDNESDEEDFDMGM